MMAPMLLQNVVEVHVLTRAPMLQTAQCSMTHRFPEHLLRRRSPSVVKKTERELALCLATPSTGDEFDDDNVHMYRVLRTRYWLEKTMIDDRVRERYVKMMRRLRRAANE